MIILSAAVSCNLCYQKFNNLNAVKKHLSNCKELKFKEILKHQHQAAGNLNAKNILTFPMKVQDINSPFRMLREAEAECPLIEGNKNCFRCIRKSKKSIIRKAHKEEPKADPPIKPDTPINIYTWFCLNTAKSKFSLVSPVADW